MKWVTLTSGIFCVALAIPSGAFAAETPAVTQASVERTDSDQLVRLLTSPAPEDVRSKVVCSNDMTRVRLDGIFARKSDVEVIPVKDNGPITFVRLISRGAKGSVVQLFAGKRNMSVCARTHVSYLAGEIIISTSMTASEIARVKREQEALESIRRVIITEQPETDKPTQTTENKDSGNTENEDKNDRENPFFSSKIKATKKASKKPFGDKKEDEPETLGSVRYAAGFIFAAVIGGVAIFMLKRKKRIAGPDGGIDIISTKRIGPRQQLALASVQGKRFLLAVNDKSISTLGELPTDEPAAGTSMQNASLLRNFANELAPAVPNPSSYEPAAESIRQDVPKPKITRPEPSSDPQARFEFGQALRKVLSTPTASEPAPEKNAPIASNVAGLIAMARSKTAYDKQAKKSPTAEA